MLTIEVFRERVTALWDSQKRMAAPRKWKSGRRAGMVRHEGAAIQFTKEQLQRWLWERVGLNAIACPYCHAPIDIVSLTLDHIVPRSLGGEFALSNMEPICEDCNAAKGDLSKPAFVALLGFAHTLSAYDQSTLIKRLRAAHHGAAQRFFRDKALQRRTPTAVARPAHQPTLDEIEF